MCGADGDNRRMNAVAQLAAVVAGLVHIMIFVMESLLFTRPAVHRRFGVRAEEVAAVRPWAFNQGFYNLFLAAGALVGLFVVWGDAESAGRAVVVFACASMVVAALVLLATNIRMASAAAVQGVAPLIALAFIVFG
jgi:putative membrane protein